MKVLIVDDNGYDRRILRYTLEHHGCTDIVEANDGEEGMAKARSDRPDLIISDALMPRMDGFQFLKSVKGDPALALIPFIFHSATYAGDKEIKLALALGAETFIVKPKEPEEFWKEISGIMERCIRREAARPAEAVAVTEESEFLKKYSQIVSEKLEEKIGELEEAKTRLERSEAFVRNILETVDEGFTVLDRDFRIISANRAYCEEVGMPLEKVLDSTCYACSHHTDKPCYELGEDCPVRKVFESGEPQIAVHTHRTEAGAPVYIEAKAYPMKDQTGAVVSAIEICIDVTEKTRLEEQLRHAQKMEAIGRLAGGVAHDFNNILTAIIGYGNILLMKLRAEDPLRAHVDQILQSSQRAASLTQSLLAFSRKQILKPVRVNLTATIRNLDSFLHRIIGEDIELRTRSKCEDLIVKADVVQIEQVLMNLATNARDAMPQGGTFTIELDSVLVDQEFINLHGSGRPGLYALVTVSDTGTGMDEETQKRIFEPFFTTKDVGKGTGLGLPIVYGIIQQHGGLVTVTSLPGTGTTFMIYLPLAEPQAGERQRPQQVGGPTAGEETILLAEDDAVVRDLTAGYLKDAGYAVITARDGNDAVIKFSENRDTVRLCILDLIMPQKNGRRAYQEIKALRPDARAVYISGYPAQTIHKEEAAGEQLDIILKPFTPQELLARVRTILDAVKA